MNLEEQYLRGAIDAFIKSYKEGVRDIPAEVGLEYTIEYGNSAGKTTSAKITFNWIEQGETTCTDSETNSYETEQIEMDDYFTILGGEDIEKLRDYVEEVLEKITIAQ